jgi:putative oxidoreductase
MSALDLGSGAIVRRAATLAPAVRAATGALERFALPLLLLTMRLWIARIFFKSGLTKIDDWTSTRYLFEHDYALPLLAPGPAAVIATFLELAMPALLAVGLATRPAALALLGMAMVIQFVLGAANPAFDNAEHFYWMFLTGTLVVLGAGSLSLDHLIARRFGGK